MSIWSPEVNVDNVVTVDGSATTQPISAASLPLPVGAATNAAVLALTKPSDTQLVDGSAHTQPVSGTVAVSNLPATQPVSGSVSVSNFPATQPVSGTVSVGNTVNVITANASTATITQVTTTNSSQQLLAANVNRKSAIIFVATANCLIAFGSAASASNFTYNVTSANTYVSVTGWTGAIFISQASGKLVTVTELV